MSATTLSLPASATSSAPDPWPDLEFIHIPKNGGTSIEAAGSSAGYRWGANKFWGCGSAPAPCQDSQLQCSWWHVPRGVLRSNPDLLPLDMDGPDPYVGRRGQTQTFCVVRHPLERAISQYIYWSMVQVGCGKMDGACAQQQQQARFDDACKPHALNRYIHERFNGTSGRWTRAVAAITRVDGPLTDEVKRLGGTEGEDCHWLPQWMHTSVLNQTGVGPREDTVESVPMCDHVLKMESLDSDLQRLAPVVARLVRSQAKARVAGEYCTMRVGDLDAASIAQLGAVYARDFEEFGYSATLLAESDVALGSAVGSASAAAAAVGLQLHPDRRVGLDPFELDDVFRQLAEVAARHQQKAEAEPEDGPSSHVLSPR